MKHIIVIQGVGSFPSYDVCQELAMSMPVFSTRESFDTLGEALARLRELELNSINEEKAYPVGNAYSVNAVANSEL